LYNKDAIDFMNEIDECMPKNQCFALILLTLIKALYSIQFFITRKIMKKYLKLFLSLSTLGF